MEQNLRCFSDLVPSFVLLRFRIAACWFHVMCAVMSCNRPLTTLFLVCYLNWVVITTNIAEAGLGKSNLLLNLGVTE